jgi:hypothetical protein
MAEIRFAAMKILSMLIIGLTSGIIITGTVHAAPSDVAMLGPTVPLELSSECDSNYSGACVPAGVSDVDCASGDGNGPEYVDGPVYVDGDDIYSLDSNGDGVGCES